MSTNFHLESLPIEEFLPLFQLSDEELHKRRAKWLVADTSPGNGTPKILQADMIRALKLPPNRFMLVDLLRYY